MLNRAEYILNKWWGMAIAIAIPVFLAYAGLFLGLQVEGSLLGLDHPLSYFFHHAASAGDSLLWNPTSFSGFPSFADSTYLSPLFYFFSWFLTPTTLYYWSAFLFSVLAGFYTALLLKQFGVGAAGQYTGAIVYFFSSTFIGLVELGVVASFFILPLLMWITLCLSERKRLSRTSLLILAGAAGVAFGWFGMHWHFLINNLLVGFLFSLYLYFCRRSLRPLFIYAGTVALGTLFGLLKIVPAYVFLSLSSRVGSSAVNLLSGEGFSWSHILPLLSPSYVHPLFFTHSEWIYVGMLPLFLAASVFTRRLFGRHEGFFSYLIMLALLLGFVNSPFFRVLQLVPPFNFTHTATRWIYVVGFGIAALSGFAVDRLRKGELSVRMLKTARAFTSISLWAIFLGVVGSALVFMLRTFRTQALFLLKRYFDEFMYSVPSDVPLERYHAYIDKLFYSGIRMFDVANPWFLIPFIFLIFSCSILYALSRRKIIGARLAWIIVGVVAANAVFVQTFSVERTGAQFLRNTPETVAFIQKTPHTRTLSFLDGDIESKTLEGFSTGGTPRLDEWIMLSRTLLKPPTHIQYGIESVGYFATVTNRNMASLVDYVGGATLHTNASLRNMEIPLKEKARMFAERRPIINLLGASHILSSYLFDERVFRGVFKTTSTPYNIPVYVYENTQARPLYYFTREQELLNLPETSPAALQELMEKTDNVRTVTQDGIVLRERKNALLALTTTTASSALLVFSQNNLPGWQAWIDGQRIPIHTFATIYQAVRVPEGTHTVRLEFAYGEIWRMFLQNILSR